MWHLNKCQIIVFNNILMSMLVSCQQARHSICHVGLFSFNGLTTWTKTETIFWFWRIEVDTKLIYGLKWELTQNVETKPGRIFLLVDWWQRPKRKWFSDFKDWGRHKISHISTFASTILTRWNLTHFTDANLTIQNQTIPTTNKQRIINKNHIHKPRFST